jgi:hypothetical protein
MKNRVLPILAIAALWSSQSLAQAAAPVSDANTELSKEIENPVTRRITLPLRYEADFLDGAYKATKDTFEIDQAVVRFRLNDDWALIIRNKLPVDVEPLKKFGDHWATGLFRWIDDILSVAGARRGFVLGVGPVLYYPSATNSTVGVNNWAPVRRRHS